MKEEKNFDEILEEQEKEEKDFLNLKEKLAAVGKKKVAIVGGSILGVLLVVYAGMSVFFMSHFYPNTTINGAKAAGAKVDAVKERILKEADEYSLTIEEDGTTETINQADVDLKIDVESGMVEKILEDQSGWGWVGALFKGSEYDSENIVSYDKEKLDNVVSDLKCVTAKDTKETKNAQAVYKDGEFVAEDEIYGNTIDIKSFEKKLNKAILSLDDTINLEKDKCYIQPDVTADSKELKKLIDKMNDVLDMDVTYTVGSSKETVPVDEIASWLSSTDSKSLTFDEEAMSAFVEEMGTKYNTFGQSKSLTTATGANVTVPGGSYGWKIDTEGEVAQLKEDLSSGKWTDRDFVYKYSAASHDGNDYGNSYVEVNLTAQHVYLVVNGSLVYDTACVTGRPSNGHATPAGAYGITYCEKNAILRGPGYATQVAYWMPFNGDIGLHDATWQSAFGGNRYLTHGSHGCVNLPLSAAKTIYGYVSAGFPVLCYNLGGSETAVEGTVATPEEQANAVIDKINAIGQVTLDSGAAISDARNSYNALSDEAKSLVTNLNVLDQADAEYNAQVAAQQAQIETDRQNHANAIIDQVNAATDEAGLAAAQAAYDAAPDEVKAKVGDIAALIAQRRAALGL